MKAIETQLPSGVFIEITDHYYKQEHDQVSRITLST